MKIDKDNRREKHSKNRISKGRTISTMLNDLLWNRPIFMFKFLDSCREEKKCLDLMT